MLEKRSDLNNTEMAYELGLNTQITLPSFSKNKLNLTPKEYGLQVAGKNLNCQRLLARRFHISNLFPSFW